MTRQDELRAMVAEYDAGNPLVFILDARTLAAELADALDEVARLRGEIADLRSEAAEAALVAALTAAEGGTK